MVMVKSIFINVLIVFTVFVGIALAENSLYANVDASEYMTYTISDGEVTITDFDESFCGDVIIPSVIEGYPVTSIGDEAFAYCQDIYSIEVPDSVTYIGKGAFFECWNLMKMTLPFVGNTLNGTENTHFGYIFGADDYTQHSEYMWGRYLDELVITGETSLDSYAFYQCIINKINLPDGITTIGEYTFYMAGLESIIIPDSVTYIGEAAFYMCNFESVTIPKNVTHIGAYAFFSGSLQRVEILCDNLETWDMAFYGSRGITDLTISGCVKSIGYLTFAECGFESLTIPDCVTSIENDAFLYCQNLTSVTIPDSVTHIGFGAFAMCPLVEISLPFTGIYADGSGPTNFEAIFGTEDYYENCGYPLSLRTVTITGGTEIADYAFLGCEMIERIILSDGITTIGNSAFERCICLIDIKIPDSVIRIGDSAFKGCCCLPDVELPESLLSIGAHAFSGCSYLPDVTFPEGLKRIGSGAFEGCQSFRNVKIPSGVTELGSYIFFDCPDIERIELPCIESECGYPVEFYAIFGFDGSDSFYHPSLKEVVINGGSTLYTFWESNGITSVTIPASITKIDLWSFDNCNTLEKIIVSEGNEIYSSIDGVLYNKEKTAIIRCPEGKSGTIVFPDSMENINERSFYNCTEITDVTIPKGAHEIGWYAFYGCSGLTKVIIPDSVTVISDSAFIGCYNLEKIIVPFVGSDFDTIFGSIFGAYDYHFQYEYVPATLKEVVVTNADNIDEGSFCSCVSFTDVTILGEVTSIGPNAFLSCVELTYLTLTNSITDIGESAFCYCNSLSDVYFLGTEAEWNSINVADGNFCLLDATIHFIDGFSVSDNSSMKVDDEKGFVSSIEIGNTVSDIVSQFDTYGDIAVVDSEGNALADNSVIATGYKVRRVIEGVVVDEIDTVVAGDTDGDGAATIADTQNAYSLLMGSEPVSGVYAEAAKATGGSTLSILDVMAILNKI